MVLVLVLAAVAGLVAGEEEACRPRPLGLMDHTIRDWQLAASSVVSRAEDPECAVKHARLYAEGGRAWCPEQRRENEWILVDLGVQSEIAAVMTQGRDKRGGRAWVTHYHISYSGDAYRWEWARDIYGDKKVTGRAKPQIGFCCKIFSAAEREHGQPHSEGLLPGAPRHRQVPPPARPGLAQPSLSQNGHHRLPK